MSFVRIFGLSCGFNYLFRFWPKCICQIHLQRTKQNIFFFIIIVLVDCEKLILAFQVKLTTFVPVRMFSGIRMEPIVFHCTPILVSQRILKSYYFFLFFCVFVIFYYVKKKAVESFFAHNILTVKTQSKVS